MVEGLDEHDDKDEEVELLGYGVIDLSVCFSKADGISGMSLKLNSSKFSPSSISESWDELTFVASSNASIASLIDSLSIFNSFFFRFSGGEFSKLVEECPRPSSLVEQWEPFKVEEDILCQNF